MQDKKENEKKPIAILAPHGKNKSIRADKLSQDALDLIAYFFSLPLHINGIEVKLDKPVENILEGGNNRLHTHQGSDSLRYFSRRDDPEWAVVFANDCSGDAGKGLQLVDKFKLERMSKKV